MSASFKLSPEEDTLSHLRNEFIIPTFRSMKAAAVPDQLRTSTPVNPGAHAYYL